ncbi:hypothetical protein [Demequina sp.]|uniref:hypothetical protein n=1 Tax=Demequina sp. TaxID=2050685 RepID=UPI003D0FBEC5
MIDPNSTTLYPTALALLELRRRRPALYINELTLELERIHHLQDLELENIRVELTAGLDRISDDVLMHASANMDSKIYEHGCVKGLWDPHLDPATALFEPAPGEVGLWPLGTHLWLWTFDDERHELVTVTLNENAIPTPTATHRGESLEHCVQIDRGVVAQHASAAILDLGLHFIHVDANGRPVPRAAP